MPDNPPEPPPPPPPPPLSPRASNSALPRTPSSKRPSNKQVDVGDGGMLAAIASPDKRPSLKKTQSDDKSSPMIDAEASLISFFLVLLTIYPLPDPLCPAPVRLARRLSCCGLPARRAHDFGRSPSARTDGTALVSRCLRVGGVPCECVVGRGRREMSDAAPRRLPPPP